tara:strand:- start:3745 stop:5127 length:1383 start_codon:yes stop_codon:yes gene_type:complete
MVSTYVNNLRLEEMATGANSGTWGTKTNVNLELVGQALGYGTRAIANASTDNITIADGTSDADRSMYLKLTGGGQACTITLLPNTSSKMWVMQNATSFALTFTQGSGANVIIAAGQTKMIFADGLGSGAVVYELGAFTLNGDVTTAGTFNALGDTSAADKASLGYTAAEGLILTGQGSTNDVTIKNDADADVIEIPTGTVNVTMAGTLGVTGKVTGSADVQGTNFIATGDTAAGDLANVGYTSVLGAIITGQGSTNDVTLVNDADATVLGIPTGTTNVDIVGVATATTFEPDGDTAAGDNAAIGYTAAEGLILTGQGSTNDVTIKNDADADVIEIPTGTTNVTVAGQLNGGTIILAETDTDTSNTGSVTIDFSAHQNFVLTLTGNVTLANPSTESVGQAGVFVFIQDGTGSRTLSLGTDYESPAGEGITLSTTASAVDVVPYFVKASGSIQLGTPQLAFS